MKGHSGEVFATRFDPSGQFIASGSMDRTILLWRTYGACENYGILAGHKGAVLDLHWSRDSKNLFSASADMNLASWDLETGQRIRRHEGHEEVVNSMDISKRGVELLVSGSDDGYIGVRLGLQSHFTSASDCKLTSDRYGTPDKRQPLTSSQLTSRLRLSH